VVSPFSLCLAQAKNLAKSCKNILAMAALGCPAETS
jgi:hypothetical protein